MSTRWKGATFTRERIVGVAVIAVLALLSLVLPYLTIDYVNATTERVTTTEAVIGASQLLGSLDPLYLPDYDPAQREVMALAINVFGVAPTLQWVAALLALITVGGQFVDEINKFFWWPLHLVAYVLMLTAVPTFVGLSMLRAQGGVVSLGPAWAAAALAGIAILVVTFRSHHRIDSYRGI